MTGSNRRPPGCKPGALPAELTAPRKRRSRARLSPTAVRWGPAPPIVGRSLAARGESSLQRGPGHYREVPSSSDTSILNSEKSWRGRPMRFQGGRGGLSGHARVGRRREWHRTRLGGSPLSAPQQREGRVWPRSGAPRPAAEVPRCAGRAVEAELGRIHVLRILDPVGEPAAPVEAARAAAGHADHRVRQPLSRLGLPRVVSRHPLRVRPPPAGGSGLSAELLPTVRLVRGFQTLSPGEKASDRPVAKLWLS